MVCLITGAAGMMGSHLYDALKDTDVIPTYYKSTLDSREDIVDEMEVLDVLRLPFLDRLHPVHL